MRTRRRRASRGAKWQWRRGLSGTTSLRERRSADGPRRAGGGARGYRRRRVLSTCIFASKGGPRPTLFKNCDCASSAFKTGTPPSTRPRRRSMASDDRRERGLERDDRLIDADAESLSFDPLGLGQRTPPRAAQTRDETADSLRERANVVAHEQKLLEAAYTDTIEQVKAGVDVLPERNNHTLLESLRESSERVVELETAAEVAEQCEERRPSHGRKRGHVRRTATHEGDSKKITGSDRTPERPADPLVRRGPGARCARARR